MTNPDKETITVPKGFDKDTVVQIINSVINKIQKPDMEVKTALQQELVGLHQIIQDLRGEIANVQATSIQSKEIPTATDELDAVVEATEEATSTIMDSVEAIENVSDSLDDADKSAKISDEVCKIYEACSFQDITGQRITKVVTALRSIEAKVDQLLTVVSESFPGALEEQDEQENKDKDPLLNGPAAPDQKVSQDDIDAILAEFDD